MSVSDDNRGDVREAECPACGRTIRWMRGADRPDCAYCGRRVSPRKRLELDEAGPDEAEETKVLVSWREE